MKHSRTKLLKQLLYLIYFLNMALALLLVRITLCMLWSWCMIHWCVIHFDNVHLAKQSLQVQALDLGSCLLLPCYIIGHSEYKKLVVCGAKCQKLCWVSPDPFALNLPIDSLSPKGLLVSCPTTEERSSGSWSCRHYQALLITKGLSVRD